MTFLLCMAAYSYTDVCTSFMYNFVTLQDNRTPLHYACVSGSVDVTAALLSKSSSKVFLNMQDRYGDTALHIASRCGYREVVKQLLSYRANKDILNEVYTGVSEIFQERR